MAATEEPGEGQVCCTPKGVKVKAERSIAGREAYQCHNSYPRSHHKRDVVSEHFMNIKDDTRVCGSTEGGARP